MYNEEYYKEQTEEYIKELTRYTDLYINVSELVERFVEVDEEYNHEDWNLMQILANINMLVPVKMEET